MRGGDETTNNFKSPLEETNEFKYSKEFMLSLYQPYQIPDRFERHEHITVEESLPPKSFEPPSEAEKKVVEIQENKQTGILIACVDSRWSRSFHFITS
jgi:hypothetical protein